MTYNVLMETLNQTLNTLMPYLTLPIGEGVLPPSTEASSGPNAHTQINFEVTRTSWSSF